MFSQGLVLPFWLICQQFKKVSLASQPWSHPKLGETHAIGKETVALHKLQVSVLFDCLLACLFSRLNWISWTSWQLPTDKYLIRSLNYGIALTENNELDLTFLGSLSSYAFYHYRNAPDSFTKLTRADCK